MKLTRQRLAILTAVATLAAVTTGGGRAIAVSSADETSTPNEAESPTADPNAGDDAGADAVPVVAAPTSVSLSGGLSCSIPSIAEASTRWRFGRTRTNTSIDETTSRLRVSGSGSGCDGLKVDFSVELLLPTLKEGSYDLSPTSSAAARAAAPPLWANLWARADRASATPEIEWDTRLRSPGAPVRPPKGGASLAVTITSVTEISHTSERLREGTVTMDTTRFRVHGSVAASLPCTRAVAWRQSSCRAETLLGSF